MSIELPKDTTESLVASIKLYFLEERGEEIGDLQAGFLLEFFLKEAGPSIYNKAVRDTQTYLARIADDLDSVIFK